MKPLDINALPFSSKASICWGVFWRGLVISLGSALCGGVAGGIAGFVLGLMGFKSGVAVVGFLLGTLVGIFFLFLFIRWLLSSRIGRFKFLLVEQGALRDMAV